MNSRIEDRPNWIYEACTMLKSEYQDESREERIKSQKERKEYQEFREFFDQVEAITQTVDAEMIEQKDRLKFYFKERLSNSSFVEFLLLDYRSQCFSSLQEAKEYVRNLSSETRIERFWAVFVELEDDDMKPDVLSLFDAIVKSECSSEEKIQLQQMYLNPEPYLEEVCGLLENVIAILQRFEQFFFAQAERCSLYWKRILGSESCIHYMKRVFQIEISNEEITSVMIPSVMGYGMVAISAVEKENVCDQVVFFIGATVTDEGRGKEVANAQDVSAVLKLLADRSKLDILTFLKENRSYGGELAKRFNLSTATISHHMTALIAQSLVAVERENNRIYYRTNLEQMKKFTDALENLLL